MAAPLALLQVVGKAALPIITGGASTVIEVGATIASQVWEWWGKKSKEEERRKELEALAQLNAAELRQAVHDLAGVLAGDRSPADRSRLEGYLLAVPAQIRRTLRRPSDIAGSTVPPDLVLSRMEDLIPLLPSRPPQFVPGERAPGTDYELVELLGIGGFGEVWKARNAFMPGAPAVALKFCLDSTAAASLRRETELLDRIQHQSTHPGIVQLRHTFLRAEPPFLEYELVEGGDLGGLIVEWHGKKGGPSPDQAARLIRRLAEIVAFAHKHGIIHRDLKPANILVQGSGIDSLQLKIADFGIGSITTEAASRAARVTGLASTRTAAAASGGYSLYYASPEQVRGAPADPRDDVHAIGVIWYQLLVGDLTAEAPRGPGWKKRLAAKGMNAGLIELLEACTATDREDRPASAVGVAEQIGLLFSAQPPAPTIHKMPSRPLSPPALRSVISTEAMSQVVKDVSAELRGISLREQRERFLTSLANICTILTKLYPAINNLSHLYRYTLLLLILFVNISIALGVGSAAGALTTVELWRRQHQRFEARKEEIKTLNKATAERIAHQHSTDEITLVCSEERIHNYSRLDDGHGYISDTAIYYDINSDKIRQFNSLLKNHNINKPDWTNGQYRVHRKSWTPGADSEEKVADAYVSRLNAMLLKASDQYKRDFISDRYRDYDRIDPTWAMIIATTTAVLTLLLLWRGQVWFRRRKVRRLTQRLDKIIASLHSEFPTEMAALGDINLRDPIAVQEVSKQLDRQLARR